MKDKENKEAEREKVESDKNVVSKMEADIAERETKINELIHKKSKIDRMVPYDGKYLSLTGVGVMMLNDLIVRNYRVSDEEFSDFIEEIQTTFSELRSHSRKRLAITYLTLKLVSQKWISLSSGAYR